MPDDININENETDNDAHVQRSTWTRRRLPEIEESLHGERSDTGGDQGKSKVGVVGDEDVIRPEEKWLGVD